MKFYEKSGVRIHYEEAGSGFPLLLIAGGGLNSTISALSNPFDPIPEFKRRVSAASRSDLRNAKTGSPPARWKSTGRGTHTPTIISVSWITWASTSSW